MRQNRLKASTWCAWIASTFRVATVADWIILSSHLPETPENREFGLECDKALIERCDELWMVGPQVSGGMQIEAGHAHDKFRPVYDLVGLSMDRLLVEAALAEQGRCMACGASRVVCGRRAAGLRSHGTRLSQCCPDCTHGFQARLEALEGDGK